ncbi:hypothetical protein BDQ17DRAFT_574443 [Cyathus striatus]|nr:hypothetical protein BDQ17DRAFT_574443 [Cyathus striatus]
MSLPHFPTSHTRFPPTFVGIYGAHMIASIINSVLFGVGTFVGMQYLRQYGKTDPMVVKGTVCFLMVMATLETIFTNHQTYAYFIDGFGDMANLNNIVLQAKYLFVYITSFVSQLFFSGSIWIISSSLGPRNRLLVVPVLLLAATQFTAGIIQVSMMWRAKTFAKLGIGKHAVHLRILSIQAGGTAACDLLITIILVYIFRKTNTAEHRTKSLLDKLINYALNRAAATCFCAFCTVFFLPLLLRYKLLCNSYTRKHTPKHYFDCFSGIVQKLAS